MGESSISRYRTNGRFMGWGLLSALFAVLLANSGSAQTTVTITEINPISSTLDATNPNGASGGRVNGLAATRTGTTYYAATEWGGLYKSTNGGRVWRRLDSYLPVATWDVDVDQSDSARVYATSFYDGRVNSLAGISVSSDGGRSWVRPATATPPVGFCLTEARRDEPSAFGIAIDPIDSRNVYVGTNCGLAVSTNYGLTWRFIDPTAGDPADNVWDVVVRRDTIDLCGDDGHQRSIDRGATWITAAGAGLPAGRCSLARSPDESYVLLASQGGSILESDDGGATWPTALTNPGPGTRLPFLAINQRAGATFDLWYGAVTLHREACTTPATPAVGGAARCPANAWAGPFTTTVGAHADPGDLEFNHSVSEDGCPVLFASDGGVYYNTVTSTPNCHTPAWEQPDTTPRALWLFALAGANQTGTTAEDLYFGNQDNGTYSSTNAAATPPTWTNVDCCDGFDVAAEPTRVVYTVCCSFVGGAFRSTLYVRSNGMTGGGAINNLPAPGFLPANPLGWHPPDIVDVFGTNSYVLITTSGVFATTNIGAIPIGWTPLGAATTPANARGVKAAVTGGTPTFFVLAGQGDGATQDQLWSYTGTAAGGNWQQINPPGGQGGFGIFDVDPVNPNRIIASHLRAGVNPSMVLSTDGGANWTTLGALDDLMTGGGAFRYQTTRGPTYWTGFGGYPQPTLVAFDPDDRNLIVAGGADAGLFVSTDRGTNWMRVSDPFNPCCSGRPHIPRPWFAYFDHEPSSRFFYYANVYVGTQGRGVWRVTLSRRNIWVACKFIDCRSVTLSRGTITVDLPECLREPCDIFVDSLPKNCTLKFDCPGCTRGLCPPYHYLFLDELDPMRWDIALFREDGELADFRLFRSARGVVLSFRPTKEAYIDKRIGNYVLALSARKGARPGRYTIRTRLEVSDRHFPGGEELQPRDK